MATKSGTFAFGGGDGSIARPDTLDRVARLEGNLRRMASGLPVGEFRRGLSVPAYPVAGPAARPDNG